MKGAEEQRDHYKISGKYKDSHMHRILGEQKEGGRKSSKKFLGRGDVYIGDLERKRGFGQREQFRGQMMEGVPDCA